MLERRRRRRSLSSTGKIGKFILEEAVRTQPARSLYRSYDPFLDRKVAIKIIQLFDPSGDEDPVANDAFYSEAQAIGRLQHQNIVSVYDAGVGDYEGYIVMEYVEGESLLTRLKRDHMLPVGEALEIAAEICHALDYAHKKKIIHRDIKPSNIMITPEGQIKVVDFGISIIHSDGEKDVTLMGTPSYMAPELIDGAKANEQSDLFSVAVLLYEMVVGKLPFSGNDAHAVLFKIINDEPEQIDRLEPKLLRDLLIKALAKNPDERFESAGEFERELLRVSDQINLSDSSFQDLDTEQFKQLEIFTGCDAETLHILSRCLELDVIEAGETLTNSDLQDEYWYIAEGEVLLECGDKQVTIKAGQWLSEALTSRVLKFCTVTASVKAQVIRVSQSKVLNTSASVQAYFFKFVLERLFVL